jgi:hypothetical protein
MASARPYARPPFSCPATLFAGPDEGDSVLRLRSGLRLSLHSGLRQQGTGLWPGFCGPAEAVPFRGCGCPEESSPLVGLGAEGEAAVACCSAGDGHGIWPGAPQRLKPMQGVWVYGTTEVVPLRFMVGPQICLATETHILKSRCGVSGGRGLIVILQYFSAGQIREHNQASTTIRRHIGESLCRFFQTFLLKACSLKNSRLVSIQHH